ncbi:MAG: hypothetical protein LAT78_11610 [Roseinatronobacter sp.]|jgi:hypothetical protein|nr:hypothetical protein [Roseinatronobacter sp.]
MSVNDALLRRILSTPDDIPSAPLALKLLVNRLRIQIRANPSFLTGGVAELRDHLRQNPQSRAIFATL